MTFVVALQSSCVGIVDGIAAGKLLGRGHLLPGATMLALCLQPFDWFTIATALVVIFWDDIDRWARRAKQKVSDALTDIQQAIARREAEALS